MELFIAFNFHYYINGIMFISPCKDMPIFRIFGKYLTGKFDEQK